MDCFPEPRSPEFSFEAEPHMEAIDIAVDVNFKWI